MITDSFDPTSEPVIHIKDVYGDRKDLADVCICTFSAEIFSAVRDEYNAKEIACIPACNGKISVLGFDHKGRRVAVYLSPLGAALAAETMAEVTWLTGAQKAVLFGSAGSLDNSLTQNRFVIPTASYRDEGASYHFMPPSDYITIKNSDKVKEVFDHLCVPYVEGKTWTTDAFLRETRAETKKRRDEGCLAVEMELAGVQASCNYFCIDLYAFVVTGDVLSDEAYSRAELTKANHSVDHFRLALELACRV